jgi:receptor protein-tyrosine kinase
MNVLNEAIFALRATVEAALPQPGALVVTSPSQGDGAALLACDLARAFAAGELRTMLIAANRRPMEAALALESRPLPLVESAADLRLRQTLEVAEYLDAVAVPERLYRSSLRCAALLAALRERYDAVIVVAAEVLEGAADIARSADGVLLAVRHKRFPKRADGASVEMLRRVGAQLVGIVTTDYAARRAPNGRAPAREAKHINVVDVGPERAASLRT